MHSLYQPPRSRHAQAVPSGAGKWRRPGWHWMVPVLGLLPIFAVVALAAQGTLRLPLSPTGEGRAPGAPPTAVTATGQAQGPGATGQPPGPAGNGGAAQSQPTAAGQAEATTAGAGTAGEAGRGAAGAGGQAAGAAGEGGPAAVAAGAGGGATTAPGVAVAAEPGTFTGTAVEATGGVEAATPQPFVAYRVQAGDTVRIVASMYGVSPASISQASGLRDPDILRVGQVLTIPAQPGWLYRVQSGETLDQIAARAGIASEAIASASGLTAASVRAGDVVLIPDQASLSSK